MLKLNFYLCTFLISTLNLPSFAKSTILKELDINSDLYKLKENITFHIKDYLTFPHEQKSEPGLMRSIFFQNGKIYDDHHWLKKDTPWCFLRIKIKEKKTTFVDKGEVLIPLDFQKSQNNSQYDNYSYAFFDFNKGKSLNVQKKWIPFSFKCNFIRGTSLRYHQIKTITGAKVLLYSK